MPNDDQSAISSIVIFPPLGTLKISHFSTSEEWLSCADFHPGTQHLNWIFILLNNVNLVLVNYRIGLNFGSTLFGKDVKYLGDARPSTIEIPKQIN